MKQHHFLGYTIVRTKDYAENISKVAYESLQKTAEINRLNDTIDVMKMEIESLRAELKNTVRRGKDGRFYKN